MGSFATCRDAAGFRRMLYPFLSAALVVGAGGCAGVKANQTLGSGHLDLPKPDVLVVCNFASTPKEVTLDKGLLPGALRGGGPVSDQEQAVGHMVADRLAQTLVQELQSAGINAVRNGPDVRPTATTGFVHGEFVKVDQGNQDARVWIGFGTGGSQIKTRIQMVQDGKLVAEGDTSTTSNLKPGMLTSMGAGAAGAGAAVAVGAVSAGGNEAFLGTVDADARRTAKEVARKIKQGYVARGWL